MEYDLKVACGADTDDRQFSLDHSHAEYLNIRTLGRCVRTRLYFTSESHLYTLLNVLMYSGMDPNHSDSCLSEEGRRIIEETAELSYLTQVTIRLFDVTTKDIDDPERFRCEISFSPGSVDVDSEEIAPPSILNKNISCAQMLQSLEMSIAAGKSQSSTPKVPFSHPDSRDSYAVPSPERRPSPAIIHKGQLLITICKMLLNVLFEDLLSPGPERNRHDLNILNKTPSSLPRSDNGSDSK